MTGAPPPKTVDHVLSAQKMVTTDYDLDKLANAVATAETGLCKDGTARKRNNCHGIMQWHKGIRSPRHFKTTEDSFIAFKEIWAKSYKRYPDISLARKWTGNDHAQRWLNTVNQYYNSH